MEMKRTGPNTTIIETNGGDRIFFSYSEPVAAFKADTGTYIRTNKFFSVTTSKHINAFLLGNKAHEVEHAELLKFAKEAH